MIGKSQNKSMETEEVKTKEVFHFSGSAKYEPQSVKAETREEAETIWKKTRKLIENN
ncbi:MAG: hypothetical protein WC472_01610 [Candidatus Paceibacterota bacterium]